MASLTLEVYATADEWKKIGELKPGDPIGSISNNKPNGTRDIYMFECLPDGSKSIIYRSKAGIDIEYGLTRMVTTEGAEVIKELRIGDEPYIMEVSTDRSPKSRRQIRFTYK